MQRSWLPWICSGIVLVCGGVAALLADRHVAATQEAVKQARFDAAVQRMVGDLTQRINLYEYGLRGTRGAIVTAGADRITHAQFHAYAASREFAREFPGAHGFGFIRRVPQEALDLYGRAQRAAGRADFAVRQLADARGDALVIEYVEPEARNRQAIGLDIASEEHRRIAAHEALRSGQPVLSRPITLVQAAQEKRSGFVFLIPIYRPDAPTDTPEQRWQAGVGLAYAPLIIDEVLKGIEARNDRIVVALYDMEAGPGMPPQRFFTESGVDGPAAGGMAARLPLSLYGRQWQAEFKATPAFIAGLDLPAPHTIGQVVAGVSALLAVLLFFGMVNLQQRRHTALVHARMGAIADSVSDGIVGLDARGRVTSWNRAAERMLGHAGRLVMGEPFAALANGAPAPTVAADGDVTTSVLQVERPDGSPAELQLSRTAVCAPDGRQVGTAVTVRDLTEQHSADERFRLAVDAAPTAMLMVDAQQRLVLANRKAEELFGYSKDELLGLQVDALIPMRLRAQHAHHQAGYLRDPRARPMGQGQPLFALHRDGREISVEVGLSPVKTRHGFGVLAVITDMSRRVELEAQLHAALSRLQMALDVVGLGVWVWRPDDNLLVWDEQMFSIYGVPPELRHTGNDWLAFWRTRVHPDDRTEVEDRLQQQLRGENTFDPVFRIVRESGELRYIQAAALVERTADGRPVQLVGINRDITEQKAAESRILELNSSLEEQVAQRTRQLHQALESAEAATRAKSEFLANMSHEIRSPMNAILGLCYLLERESLSAGPYEMVLRIQGAGRALLGIINDILDLSKIEADRLDIERAPFLLSAVLDSLASIMASSLGDKPLELVVGPVPAGSEHLIGDSLRLSQVLVNLASNAIKFTAHGEVVVSVERVDDGSAQGFVTLRFAVQDTGIGIEADKQAQIFEAFNQADTSTTRQYGGTGLGLTISSRLVALMGGRLTVDSTPQRGSTFAFTLELPTGAATGGTAPLMQPLRVLVADDNPVALRMLAAVVRSLGWQVDAVEDGEKAVDHACGPQARPYDVLLLDLHMPGIDGLEAARCVRANSGARQPILVMAAPRDREKLLAGDTQDVLDRVVQKPVTGPGLYNIVMEVLRDRDVLNIPVSAAVAAQRLRGLRFLVVDDSEINRDVAARILGSEGASALCAENGAEALAVLQAHGPAIDGVLMDMQMPHMDGYEATQKIRSSASLRQLVVVALSAGAFASQRAQALAAGVDAFVPKPFDVDQLVETLLRLCRPGTDAPTATPVPFAPAAPAALDIEQGLRLWGDPVVFASTLEKFLETYGAVTQQMRTMPHAPVAELAHRLKGAAAQLGIGHVAASAESLEHASRARRDIAEAIGQLQLALEGARDEIQVYLQRMSTRSTAVPPPSMSALQGTAGEMLHELLRALASDDPARVEAALANAAPHLSDDSLSALRSAVAYYEFRAAEALVRSAVAARSRNQES